MSDRITTKMVQRAYEMLRDALGKREAAAYHDVGGWMLDCNHTYGGYVIVEINNIHGGETHPLGDTRKSAREFFDACHFALRVLGVAKLVKEAAHV